MADDYRTCPHELFEVSAKAVLFNFARDKILLLHNPRGWWTTPGGHLEEGEQPIDAVRRELREELGLDFRGKLELKTADKFYKVSENSAKDAPPAKRVGKVDLYFVGELDETAPIDIANSGDNLDRYEWAKIDDVLRGDYEDWLPRLVEETKS